MADLNERTHNFTQWLLSRPETNIVVVGHSAFFRDLIGTECKMDNCEVRLVLLSEDGQFHSPQEIIKGGHTLLQDP